MYTSTVLVPGYSTKEYHIIKNNPLKLDTCTFNVTYGDEICNSCTICTSGRDITFDCSNINLNPLNIGPKIPGIEINQCIGLTLLDLFNNTTTN